MPKTFPYTFELHTLDGEPMTEAPMLAWLAENVGEHDFECHAHNAISLQWALLSPPRASKVHLREDVDAVMFRLRWCEDIALRRRLVEETADLKVQFVSAQKPDHFWFPRSQVSQVSDGIILPLCTPYKSRKFPTTIKVLKSRTTTPSVLELNYDPKNARID